MKRRDVLKSLGIGATALATLNGEVLESFGHSPVTPKSSLIQVSKTLHIPINDRQRYEITMTDPNGTAEYHDDQPEYGWKPEYIQIKTFNQHVKIHVEQPRRTSVVKYTSSTIHYAFPILVCGRNTTYGDFYITDLKNTKKLIISISENGHEPSTQDGKMRAIVWCNVQPIESKDGIVREFDSCLKIELITESK